ncbi:MAG: hypothetical protein AB7R89_02665 [Dehalococcoidia bacterium]
MNQSTKKPEPGALDMGDIVAGAWTAYLRAPGRWLALTAISFVVVVALQWTLGDRIDIGSDPTGDEVRESLPYVGVSLGVSALAELFTHTALVAGAFAVFGGAALKVGGAYATGIRRFLPALAGSLVVGLIAALLSATLILLPLAVYLFVNWSLLVQVIVNEDVGPFRAMGRSRQIVRGQWWRTLGINLAIALLAFLPGLVISRVTGPIDQQWATALGAGVGSSITAPFIALAQSLLYADLRARKGERPLSEPVGERR